MGAANIVSSVPADKDPAGLDVRLGAMCVAHPL